MAPQDVGVAYLSGSGDPCHDAVELELLALAFGLDLPLLTSITHLTGDYGGLGSFRVAAAALTAAGGMLPRLTYLHHPIHRDMRFVTAAGLTAAPGPVLAHGLGRGGTQVAVLLGPPC
jgi:3-oxoacyl-(acyl-carrier-protein) synthase